MDVCTYALLVFGSISIILCGNASAACTPAVVQSCVKEELFNRLSRTNAKQYCMQAAVLAANATKCLAGCSAAGSSSFLNDKIAEINSFCSAASSNCKDVVGTYINQTKCYDPYGGLEMILPLLAEAYVKRLPTRDYCQKLFWGRSCQRQSKCQFNSELYLGLVSGDVQVILSLAICGSEDVTDLAPFLSRNDTCSPKLYKDIEDQCAVGTELAAVKTFSDACQLLEKQAACIESRSVGCTEASQRYLLPRLDTYSIANKYLGCNVKCYGLKVQSQNEQCDYGNLIKTCFYTPNDPETIQYLLLGLFNRDLQVSGFCAHLNNITEEKRYCRLALLSCIVPQSRLYSPNNTLDDSYAPNMGVFPINVVGMTSIYTWLNGVCPPGLRWSERLYVPPAVGATTVKRTTPPPKTTPKPETRIPTPTGRKGNDLGKLEADFLSTKNRGNTVVMSFMLAVLSALTVSLVLTSNNRM